jgi:hypothetical protein
MRVEDTLWEDLRQRASLQLVTVTAYVQSLITEGLRMRDVPGIVFRDGPTGRRAALVDGPDVWEIVTALRMAESDGEGAVGEVAADLCLPVSSVETALSYYSRFPDEVDERIALVERDADIARAAWEKRQSVLS